MGHTQLKLEDLDETLFVEITEFDQGHAEALAGLLLARQTLFELFFVDVAGFEKEFPQTALGSCHD